MTDKVSNIIKMLSAVLFVSILAACDAGFGRSSNNDIEELVIDVDLDPSFDEDTYEYDAEVASNTPSVTVEAELDDDDTATMTLNGVAIASGEERTFDLANYEDQLILEFVVTAEDELTQTYTITIDISDEACEETNLNDLALTYVELEPGFTSATKQYTADVNYFVNETRAAVEKADGCETVSIVSPISNETINEETPSSWFDVAPDGETGVEIEVVAGGDNAEYSVAVTRAPKEFLDVSHFIKASNTDASDGFGGALSLSGDTFVVGAPQEESNDGGDESNNGVSNAGAAYVYVASGEGWLQEAYVKKDENEGRVITANDRFGYSVAIDGDFLAIGALGGNGGTGEVHIYSRSGTVWSHEQTLNGFNSGDEFGYSLALSGNYLIVGAPGWQDDRGKVYTYFRESDDDWEQRDFASAGNGEGAAANARFGASLAISTGLTEPEFIAGVPGTGAGGAVYLFEYDDSSETWSQQEVLRATNTESGDQFGASVDFRFNRIAVGAPGEASGETGVNDDVSADQDDDNTDNAGAAYIFARESEDDTFVQEAYLKASQDGGFNFGEAVALSANMLAVGAPNEESGSTGIDGNDDNDDKPDSGAVYIFEFSDTDDDLTDNNFENWLYQVYIKKFDNPEEGDAFGERLAFFGEVLLVATPGEDSNAEGVDGTIGDGANDSGAVFVVE